MTLRTFHWPPPRPARRRALSQRVMRDLTLRLEQLEAFRAVHGTYDVPRVGEHAELGDWLDKLRETFAARPDGHRIRCVTQEAPALHAYLMAWRATRPMRAPSRPVPFWISACWAFDFMRSHARAPTQASTDMVEVAHARWLSRWSNIDATTALARRPFRKTVACELTEIAARLRRGPSLTPGCVPPDVARLFAQAYETLAALASEEVQPCPTSLCLPSQAVLPPILARRGRFWPLWDEWNARNADGR